VFNIRSMPFNEILTLVHSTVRAEIPNRQYSDASFDAEFNSYS